jgi:hypothetical protein
MRAIASPMTQRIPIPMVSVDERTDVGIVMYTATIVSGGQFKLTVASLGKAAFHITQHSRQSPQLTGTGYNQVLLGGAAAANRTDADKHYGVDCYLRSSESSVPAAREGDDHRAAAQL